MILHVYYASRENTLGIRISFLLKPAALFLLLCGEDVSGEFQDVASPHLSQSLQSALQLFIPFLQQLVQATVMALYLIPLLLVTTCPALQSLTFFLRAK